MEKIMHSAVEQMLKKYDCHSQLDYLNATKEIFQEIALLGLWRAKFYEKAAFYGGSSLRILYGLDRFSEDLDFTLLQSDDSFDLTLYNQAIVDELGGFGFEVTVLKKDKNIDSNIESAFLKADSKKQLLVIDAPSAITKNINFMRKIKIKMEVDVRPPLKFDTEVKTLLQPIPFSVKTLIQPDLFAGKIHAILCRPWVNRVKGRDWYDFVWYIAHEIPVNLIHLRERLIQNGAWSPDHEFTLQDVIKLLANKIKQTDFENAKKDAEPFLKDPQSIALWNAEFFNALLTNLKSNIS
jgi:predicted nucleotidyltransferase component of viral defense system